MVNFSRAKSPERVFVNADSHRLAQILQNLLSNAAKFTQNGHVDLIVEEGDYNIESKLLQVKFKVVDTGIGISKEAQTRIFKPFVQGILPSFLHILQLYIYFMHIFR